MADFSGSGPSRRCCLCKHEGPSTDFYQKGQTRLGRPRYDSFCKSCRGRKTKEYVAAHKEVVGERKKAWYAARGRYAHRDGSYRRTYNSTVLAYDVQFAIQNGKCALCLRSPQAGERCFAFDHDHATGLTRGVLCSACNGGLGCFRDRIDVLQRAIAYLQRWTAEHTDTEVA